MSMISEQVKNLREIADRVKKDNYLMVARILNEAADTIEALSEKLSAKNMERSTSHYGGEWISCSERLPEEDKDVLIYTSYDGVDMAYISDENWRYTRGDEFINTVENANILAWQPLPEPYHEP